MIYGYARCSTNEAKQDIERQNRELKAAGAELVFTEYEHGDAAIKEQQEKLFSVIAAGDSIIVTEVSRLSRSTQQLCSLIDLIQEKQLRLVILNSVTIDCRNGNIDAMSKAFLQMAGVFSELEKSMISARVKSGMANAAAKGHKAGRPKTTAENIPEKFMKYYPMYKSRKINKTELAKLSEFSRVAVNKYIDLIEEKERR